MRGACLACLALFWAAPARAQLPEAVLPSPAFVSITTDELRARYDVLWAVSDVHGRMRQLEDLLFAAGLAVRGDGGQPSWNPGRAKQLLLVVGDSIDGGRYGRDVILLFKRLQEQAAAADSRVVVLLGNHEVEFLAHPLRGREDEMSRFIRTMPVAAFVGSWLFAHAGYIEARNNEDSLREYFARVAAGWSSGEYRVLMENDSILEAHNWWAKPRRMEKMKARLDTLGLDGLVFGHDPDALGAMNIIAMNADGWLTKLDTGLKTKASRGMLLRCEIARLARGTKLVMAENGKPICAALTGDGMLHDVPVR